MNKLSTQAKLIIGLSFVTLVLLCVMIYVQFVQFRIVKSENAGGVGCTRTVDVLQSCNGMRLRMIDGALTFGEMEPFLTFQIEVHFAFFYDHFYVRTIAGCIYIKRRTNVLDKNAVRFDDEGQLIMADIKIRFPFQLQRTVLPAK